MANSEGFPQHQRGYWRGRDCRGIDLSNLNLSGIDFSDAILDGANLSGADVRGAVFRRSSLVGANLSNIRSGLPHKRLVLIKNIFTFLAIVASAFVVFTSSSIATFLLDEIKIFTDLDRNDISVSWNAIAGSISLFTGAIYCFVLLRRKPLMAITVTGLSAVGLQTLAAWAVIYVCFRTGQSWKLTGDIILGIVSSSTMLVMQIVFHTAALALNCKLIRSKKRINIAVLSGIFIALFSIYNASNNQSQLRSYIGELIIASITAVLMYISWYIGRQIELKSPDYRLLMRASDYISTFFSTCFDRANLTDASLEYADLSDANLSAANLTRTNLYGCRQIETARLDRTLLVDRKVRNLLVTHQGANNSYVNCLLQGTYLVGANLQAADLTDVNLNEANLARARLDGANLTRIVAFNTDLSGASLTGACIADWSIDRTTNLTDICCDYIYLKSPTHERSPASGSFEPGGFTRIFQQVWNTVDLIFDRGVDWATFSRAWQQIEIEYAGEPLAIKSIDRKSEGTIVVTVEVPAELDKGKFYGEFDRAYQLLLTATEAKYRTELDAKERELTIYREQQASLQHLLQSLVKPAAITASSERLVFLKLGTPDTHNYIEAIVEIVERGAMPYAAAVGKLECIEEPIAAYQTWQQSYYNYIDRIDNRIKIPTGQQTNLTDLTLINECQLAAHNLDRVLNVWLDRDSFAPIKELMLKELHPSQSIQIVIQTDNSQIRQLPWQLWRFLDSFRQAEITFASHTYRSISQTPVQRESLQVLAIFGNSEGIDLTIDRQLLANLPNANVELAIAPSRQILTEKLWEKSWEIVFFAGHSSSDIQLDTGYIELDRDEKLTIPELKYALQQAIERGLKLVILNSCDGLGLATQLLALQLSQTIVMREPIPDFVAQKFLQYLLIALTDDTPLYLAIRDARERLQGLEDRYPCASWLPILCQNPSTIAENTNHISTNYTVK